MNKNLIAAAMSVFTVVGCAAHDDSDVFDDDQPTDNGDGTVALPESWKSVDVVGESEPIVESDVIDKGPGSESRVGVGPTIFSKNFTYTLTLPNGVSHFGPIISLPYNWGLSYIPAGLAVFLCHNTTANCFSITSAQSGVVSAFNGLPSNVPMILTFRVNGAGTLSPSAFGQSDQVIVNHS